MKPRTTVLAAALLFLPSALLLAQGPLTPPGAPAPTMKTLDQIDAKLEKRTPISSVPFTIGASGSYYLAGNLAVGTGSAITISADYVTLDLNGFTLSSTHATGIGAGVLLSGTRRNVTVKNGHIRGTTTYSGSVFLKGGFNDGITSGSFPSANLRVADVNVFGVANDGIDLGSTSVPTFVVERCTASVCADSGIVAGIVRDCSADTTGNSAIVADIATNCSGETVNTAAANAIGVSGGSNVENCRGISISGNGTTGGNVSNSRGTSSSGIGLFATNATSSSGTSTDGTGLSVTDATNCQGTSTTGTGLVASNASSSRGTSGSGTGLSATNALNSYGFSTSGTGLIAGNATNCFGVSNSGPAGLDANPGTASFCRGQNAGGTAITAGIAIGCTVVTGTVSSVNKFLGTP